MSRGPRIEAIDATPVKELNNKNETAPPPHNFTKMANWEGKMKGTACKELID